MLLLELKIGDIITAQFALNDFVHRAEVKEISEHTIKLSIKGNKEYILSEPKEFALKNYKSRTILGGL